MLHKGTRPTVEAYREAQAIIDQHVTSLSTGRCIDCGALGPCYRRDGALSVMFRYMWLPTRIPGASLVGGDRVH